MPEMIRVAILAVVQGIAEFLPISSSGHLVVLGNLLQRFTSSPVLKETVTLEIILHAGTLGSILVVYAGRIWQLLSRDRRVIGVLVVGTLPAVLVGLTIKTQFSHILKSPLLAGAMLIVTGLMLIVLGRLKPNDGKYVQLTPWKALAIGCFQAFAILPGISRSGSTILGGRWMGLGRDDSVTFSFLLAIPAICGATVLAIKDLVEQGGGGESLSVLLIGAGIAFAVGILALKWLIRWSREDRLHWFAFWCIPVGLLVCFFAA
ncbi:MAG: undecaprenyl-diphosphate phosphatase [Planctomycetota bacterium]